MARARREYRQAALAAELTAQLQRFRLADEIDQYLNRLRSAHPTGQGRSAKGNEWIEWIVGYRNKIDPLRQPPVMPVIPEPSPEDLRPFLNGWNPYGPDSCW